MNAKVRLSCIGLGERCYIIHNDEILYGIKGKQKNGDIIVMILEGKYKGHCVYKDPEIYVIPG
jgi:hypothetical protein